MSENGKAPFQIKIPLSVIERLRKDCEIPNDVEDLDVALELAGTLMGHVPDAERDVEVVVVTDDGYVKLPGPARAKCFICEQEFTIQAGDLVPPGALAEHERGELISRGTCGQSRCNRKVDTAKYDVEVEGLYSTVSSSPKKDIQ